MKKTEQMTLDYYQKNAQSFQERTFQISFHSLQDRFLEHLGRQGSILDFGCGSGRDALAFLKNGYDVTALDGTREFIRSLEGTGLKTVCARFEEFEAFCDYDGIWACASLLHLEPDSLGSVLHHLYLALRPGGIFYCSFKKGEFQGMRNGRYFLDQTEESLKKALEEAGFSILEIFESEDARERKQLWVNAICTRK